MPLHEKQIAYRDAMRRKPNFPRKRKESAGCYGVCCGEYIYGARLCTKCRRVVGSPVCCGYYTVHVNPRHEIPRQNQNARWKQFLRRFGQYEPDENLRVRSEYKAGISGKDIWLRHKTTNEFKWLWQLINEQTPETNKG